MKHTEFSPAIFSNAKELVAQMTLEEKASLCSGLKFWSTKPVERLGIPSFMLTDGPHGLRKQAGDADHLGLNGSVPATCFPTAVTTACSFDTELLYEIGKAMGEECRAEEVTVILGPAANIKRSPLCGRNFEYFSEDPVVTGKSAAALIAGVQSQNVGTSMKHYLANNQEKARMGSNSIVDERALREIYLRGYEIAVKEAQPWTLMCSYNKINDIYASDHKRLMTDIPRGEWGFQGAIVTDWGAMNDRVEAIKAGLDLEMPGNGGTTDRKIVEAVQAGTLDESLVDLCATRLTAMALQSKINTKTSYDVEAHNELARRAAYESAVLMKNDGALPLKDGCRIAVIGEFAKTPRYQGSGSSKIVPHHITSLIDALNKQGIFYTYARGYEAEGKNIDNVLLQEAVQAAKGADVVIACIGLPDSYESEGFDRTHLKMPDVQNKLMEALVQTGVPVVAVVSTGGVIQMPWREKVNSILMMHLAGQNSGSAAFDLLFGNANPCGKLAESWPLALEDTPCFGHYGKRGNVEYRESIYVGYRYYDKAQKAVAYPFGYGLSYTQFQYSDLQLSKSEISDQEALTVSLTVTNTGTLAGKEIVQLYVAPPEGAAFRPVRELRDFAKVSLKPEESKTISFQLDNRAFAYFNVNVLDWFVESGNYQIEIGASSGDIRLCETVTVKNTKLGEAPDYRYTAPAYYQPAADGWDVPKEQFEHLLGRPVPPEKGIRPFMANSTLGEIQVTLIGRMLYKQVGKSVAGLTGDSESELTTIIDAMLEDLPLRSLAMMSQGAFSENLMNGLIEMMNGHYLRGIKLLRKK